MTLDLDPTLSVSALLRRVTDEARPEAEYPLVFGERPAGETLALREAGAVRSACALLVRDFWIGGRRVRGGLIGSVATEPAYRGRGLAARVLAGAERTLAERGCLFTLLWAGDARYYLKRGYAPFGAEYDWWLGSERARSLPEASGVRELRPQDVPFLHRLYSSHGVRVERSLEEMRALLAVPGMLTLVRVGASSSGGPQVPQAYACLGRGRDLVDAIHEWAGKSTDVLALLRAHLERRFPHGEPGGLFLMTPPDASDLAYALVRAEILPKPGILGLGKIVDSGSAARLLADELGASASVTALESQPGCVRVRGPRNEIVADPEMLQTLLFGGPAVRDEVQGLLRRLGLERPTLPLQPFAWGLDSI